jgi:periplasmic protein TonB
MNERVQKGFLVSLVVHLLLLVCLGGLSMVVVHKLPDPIYDVTLVGGGGGPKGGGAPLPQQAEQQATSPEDITTAQKKKAETNQPAEQTSANNATEGTTNGPSGNGNETGPGNGNGSDNGNGPGNGPEPSGPPPVSNEVVGSPAVWPSYIAGSMPSPNYPVNGTVTVGFLVDKNGVPEEIYLISSSGNSGLDKAALKSARSARFSPALDVYGRAIRCRTKVPVLNKVLNK